MCTSKVAGHEKTFEKQNSSTPRSAPGAPANSGGQIQRRGAARVRLLLDLRPDQVQLLQNVLALALLLVVELLEREGRVLLVLDELPLRDADAVLAHLRGGEGFRAFPGVVRMAPGFEFRPDLVHKSAIKVCNKSLQ